MSSLTDVEKRYLEKILAMSGGVVLDYKDANFGALFKQHGVDIHGNRYQTYGTSKAKKLRAFWEQEPDALVGKVLNEMLDSYKASCDLNGQELDVALFDQSRAIVARLLGKPVVGEGAPTEKDFLEREYTIPNVQKLPVDVHVIPIVESRLNEARTALSAGAYLSVIFLCGSVLEAVLLGAAQRDPAKFNRAVSSPKHEDGSVKKFYDWSLAQLIDTACEIGLLKPDIKKFGHGLRDFRNYIHPYEQMLSGFTPDQHTAKVCFHVLKAAMASVAGER